MSKNLTGAEARELVIRDLCASGVFVAASFDAPTGVWSGDATRGVVRGTRKQFTMLDKDYYLEFWRRYANQFKDKVDKIISLEASCRRVWTDLFSERWQLASAMRESVRDVTSIVNMEAHTPPKPPKLRSPPTTLNPKVTTPIPGAKRSFDDFKKLEGFVAGLRTVKVHNGKAICKRFADGRGCDFKDKCKFEHVCDVDVDGKACGQPHSRKDHV